MRVLVTGGAGFIGSHIVDRLVRDGYRVRVVDNLSSGRVENIKHHLDANSVELIVGDLHYKEIAENLEAEMEPLTDDLIAEEAQIKTWSEALLTYRDYTKLRKKAVKNGINKNISLGLNYELKA
jgi:UDP-glucose 4-epimerase